jgi:predicted Zn-dependent protease
MNRSLLILLLALTLSSCSPSRPPVPPGTIPEPKTPSVSDEQYGHDVAQQLSERYQNDFGNPALDKIQDIVDRLTKAAKADAQPWHVLLFKDDNLKNAAATRGNHIFIWTGMLKATHTDGELAAILGHEIGHVLAGHTAGDPNEEVKRILIQILGVAAGIGVTVATGSAQVPVDLGNLASSVTTTVGEGLFINPYAKGSEFEADQIGLELMAEAKYDPKEAIEFWTRAANDPEFSTSLSFLSTHPPAPDRLERLRKLLPYAEARYQGRSVPGQHLPSIEINKSQKLEAPPTGQINPPSGDSFDLRKSVGSRDVQPIRDNKFKDWRVIADRTFLFTTPSSKSRKIGEFSRGSMVQGFESKNGWIQIDRPDRGYLNQSDLVLIYDNNPDSLKK